ncbi:MAG: histidine kinase, partial [Ramlibacter sp.]|nr:histidine kinase [Ramlibacter sp.]
MGFAAVARVTDTTLTACSVQDDIEFGLKPGGRLDVHTTLCVEARAARQPVVIDHASADPVYCNHHTPRMYNIESYISVPIVLRNGEYFGNLCAIDPRPAQVSNPRIVNMFTLFSELISFQLEAEQRQEQAESALVTERATSELREQFIAVLGHDLRNPLAAVSATAELLEYGRREPELVEMGRRLQAATRRMARLIDDVLDFARGRLGAGMGVSLAPVGDLPVALREVVAELRAANPRREVLAGYAVEGTVLCDRARVQQLLSNLVSNALTHGAPDWPVAVRVAIDGDALVLEVSNRGKPISPGNLARVFEPYWRPASSQPGGGLGLGLYICSQIVRAHGGTLQVTSSAEEGTRFSARLPTGR